VIAFLQGELTAAGDDYVWLNVGQVGYEVAMHPQQIARLPKLNSPVFVYIHTMISENDIKLYGFLAKEELLLFRRLIGVSGVGGKVALSIVATVPPDKFLQAVLSQDEKALLVIPGIGKKMASRLVFELKDKLGAGDFVMPAASGAADDEEVFDALTALGYSRSEVYPVMLRLKEAGQWGERTEEVLKQVLKALSRLK
jgi:Holliday junction DNA helicase RuvA